LLNILCYLIIIIFVYISLKSKLWIIQHFKAYWNFKILWFDFMLLKKIYKKNLFEKSTLTHFSIMLQANSLLFSAKFSISEILIIMRLAPTVNLLLILQGWEKNLILEKRKTTRKISLKTLVKPLLLLLSRINILFEGFLLNKMFNLKISLKL
jgi:hypothetical protein